MKTPRRRAAAPLHPTVFYRCRRKKNNVDCVVSRLPSVGLCGSTFLSGTRIRFCERMRCSCHLSVPARGRSSVVAALRHWPFERNFCCVVGGGASCSVLRVNCVAVQAQNSTGKVQLPSNLGIARGSKFKNSLRRPQPAEHCKL